MLRRLHFRVRFYSILAIMGLFANFRRFFVSLTTRILAILVVSALLAFLVVNWPRLGCIVAANALLTKLAIPSQTADSARLRAPVTPSLRGLAPLFSPRLQRPPPSTV